MERLWTPWRRAFVEGAGGDSATGCFLCDKPAQHEDCANLILSRGELVYALLNLYPYNSGHVLVAPYAHVRDLASLDSAIARELMDLTQRSVGVLQTVYHPDGFNVGMNLGKSAGAGVPDHLHVHVVPRWDGDTSFMPVLAESKVLPETLDQTYERLAPLFAARSS